MSLSLGFKAVLLRITQGIGGLVLIPLITTHLSAQEQGYYYAFLSLVALQAFAEMGINGVLVQCVAHEVGHCSLTKEKNSYQWIGDENKINKLSSITRFALKWYLSSGLIAAIVLSFGGFFFFDNICAQHNEKIFYEVPWIFLGFLTGISVTLSGSLALLEGFGLMRESINIKLIANFAGFFGNIFFLIQDFKLWSPVISMFLFCFVIIIGCLAKLKGPLIASLNASPDIHFKWVNEIWPFQWRIAVSWISGWFTFQAMTLAILRIEGPISAGRFGLGMQIASGLLAIATTWTQIKFPTWGMLISTQQWTKLKNSFIFYATLALSIASVGSLTVCLFYTYITDYWISSRLPPKKMQIYLLGGAVINAWVFAMASYLRAFKQEPYMGISISLALYICLCIKIKYLYPQLDLASAYFWGTLIISGVFGTIIWSKFNKSFKF